MHHIIRGVFLDPINDRDERSGFFFFAFLLISDLSTGSGGFMRRAWPGQDGATARANPRTFPLPLDPQAPEVEWSSPSAASLRSLLPVSDSCFYLFPCYCHCFCFDPRQGGLLYSEGVLQSYPFFFLYYTHYFRWTWGIPTYLMQRN